MTDAARRLVRFAEYELDPDRAELRRGGVQVKLAPQPFKVLEILVSRRGELVTRQELSAALWGDDQFVDFNAGLNFCIGQLRTALDDPAARSAIIRTLPRRGYRFVAELESEPRPPAAPPMPRRAWRFWLPMLATSAASAVLTAWLVPRVSATAAVPAHDPPLVLLERLEHAGLALADAGPSELVSRAAVFEDVIAADASQARAFALLSLTRLLMGQYRVEPPSKAFAAARAAAARALALDPASPPVQTAFGATAMYFARDWRTAGEHLQRAVELDRHDPVARQYYSRYLSAIGRHDDAITHAREAVSLAPGSPAAHTDLGLAYFYAARSDEAIRACDAAVEMLPAFTPARSCASAARADQAPPEFWLRRVEDLERAIPADQCDARVQSLVVPLARAGRDLDALTLLEQGLVQHSDLLLFAAVHPGLAPLRANPGFARLLQRLGLR